ncbi:hypothetical protein ASG35_10020 [Burkholderia sp. Leaf177]|uniref:hypothetical protein n=1 Tax=Burkholderia sp. Leaf177 TaxID=1736287 RepID=UPI00070087B8|nr:hypothetical protein [Burkholderia sp. Leaf177]KQR78718.1 hypothetical protein ASG35_10020 [Burkholderia sp. Leaf177]
MLRLPDGVDDRQVAKAALDMNVVVRPLSGYFLRLRNDVSGLLIGYGGVPEEEIEPAFDRLTEVLSQYGVLPH